MDKLNSKDNVDKKVSSDVDYLFKLVLFLGGFILSIILVACTYSITMVHTSGQATDVVDETASNTPTTSVIPTVSIPATAL